MKNPHRINVQLAPCHIPLAKNVNIKFLFFIATERLFPPKGM